MYMSRNSNISESKKNIHVTVLKNKYHVETIIHMSDILLKQTSDDVNEYKTVFDRLYSMLTKYSKPILIIVGNMLFHKCQYTEHTLGLLFEFIDRVSGILPTFFIPGRNDVSVTVGGKRDALFPLLSRYNTNQNVHYLRKTGFYLFNNLLLCLSSNYDGLFLTKDDLTYGQGIFAGNGISLKEVLKIGLYSGLVNSSGLKFSNVVHGRDAKDFSSLYDITLLGGYARYTVLSNRVVYPGNLIQQSYLEPYGAQGIVKWDVKMVKHDFVPIRNDYGFVSLFYGVVPKIAGYLKDNSGLFLPVNKPKYPKIRIEYSGVDLEECKRIVDKYSENCVGVNYVFRGKKYDTSKFNNDKDAAFRDFCRMSCASEVALEIHKDLLTKIGGRIKRMEWTIVDLKFTNMFCYKGYNYIDFSDYRQIVHLLGENGSGKTSIIDIVLFMITGKCTKGGGNTVVLNKGSTNFHCQLVLRRGGKYYRIFKCYDPICPRVQDITKLNKMLVDVALYEYDSNGQGERNISGITTGETMGKIKDYFGDFDQLVKTNILLQRKYFNYADLTNIKKYGHLIQVFGLDLYADLEGAAKRKKKDLMLGRDNAFRKVQHALDVLVVAEVNDKIEKKEEIMGNLEDQNIALDEEIKQCDIEIKDINDKLNGKKKVGGNDSELVIVQAKLGELADLPKVDVSFLIDRMGKLECEIGYLVLLAKGCASCGVKAQKYGSMLREKEGELRKLKAIDLARLKERHELLNREKELLEGRQVMRLKKKLNELMSKRDECLIKVAKNDQMMAKLEEEIGIAVENIKIYNELDNGVKKYIEYEGLVDKQGFPLWYMRQYVENLEVVVNGHLMDMTNYIVDMKIGSDKVVDDKMMAKALKKKKENKPCGVPTIEIMKRGSNVGDGSLSDSEATYFNIALRLAILELSDIGADFLVFDESFSALDRYNVQNIVVIYEKILQVVRFALIVSHCEEINNAAVDCINILKFTGYSKLNYDNPTVERQFVNFVNKMVSKT